jgi:hypothetical protein
MKTYAETNSKKPFDWNAFLNKPEHSFEELVLAEFLAGSWVTCACGSQCDAIPRTANGRPQDYFLKSYGMLFYDCIFLIKPRRFSRGLRKGQPKF